MTLHKNAKQLLFINLLMTAVLLVSFTIENYEVAFAAFVVLVISLAPHYLKASHDMHIPTGFVYTIIGFIFFSLVLGQFNNLYEKWHWYDAFLHFISAVGIGLTGFLILYVYYVHNKLRIHQGILLFYSFFFSLGIGALWEIVEFTLDRNIGSNMQVSLEDTMVDIVMGALGGLVAIIMCGLYLSKYNVPVVDTLVKAVTSEAVEENAAVAQSAEFDASKA